MFKTPILFLIFNRPDTTFLVFEEIRKIKPKSLYVAADGARPEKNGEKELCEASRSVLAKIDWDCEVKTLFREHNLGCGKAVSGALDWFFEQNEMGIILEDDCLPDPSFFNYCEVLLEKYKNDERISTIGASNYQIKNNTIYSYYFSIYSHIWGWATWRRTWNLYKYSLENYNKEILIRNFKTSNEVNFWDAIYSKMDKNYIPDTWDYQLQFINFKYNMLSIIPSVNMVKNIGFYNGTHLIENIPSYHFNLRFGSIDKIIFPETVIRDYKADLYFYNNMLSLNSLTMTEKIKRIIYKFYQFLFK